MIIGDTGVLFCLVDPTQAQHNVYKRWDLRLRTTPDYHLALLG